MELQKRFEEAVSNSKNLGSRPSNDVMLQLYSLYKQATVGDASEADQPSNAFDFVAKAKYNAWEEQKGKSKDDAMKEYINLVQKLQS